MGAVEKDLADYERRTARQDALELARQEAIEAEAEILLDLPLRQIVERFPGAFGWARHLLMLNPVQRAMLHTHGDLMVRVDMDALVQAIAETIVDVRKPDDGFDPDNQPAPRYWEGP